MSKEIRLVVSDDFDADRFVESLLKGRILWTEWDNYWVDACTVDHPAINKLYQGGGKEDFFSGEVREKRTF